MWKSKRILIVDDEEFCIAAMKSMMGLLGVDITNHVDFCFNGSEAVDTVKKAES